MVLVTNWKLNGPLRKRKRVWRPGRTISQASEVDGRASKAVGGVLWGEGDWL